VEEIKYIEYAVKAAKDVFNVAGWEIMGIFGAQLLATRGTNFWRAVKRGYFPSARSFNPMTWHALTFAPAFCLSTYSFSFKYDNYEAVVFVSFILACFNNAIVEWMHRKARKNETADAVFNKIVYIDESDATRVVKAGAFVSGITLMRDSDRDDETEPRTEVWTEKQREQARKRSCQQ